MTKTNLANIFIHGSFANSQSWKKILKELDQKSSNYVVDLPGHGGTADPDDFESPTLKPEIDAIKKLIENKMPDKDLHLIGHSYGGVVALGITMQKILPVKKLTLFEPVDVSVLPIFNEVVATNEISKFMTEHKKIANIDDAAACARVIDFWGGHGSFEQIPVHIQKQMILMTKNNMRHWENCRNNGMEKEEYNNLNIPVTLVHGSRSNSVAKAICTSLHRNLPNSNIHIINGASHFMITSHPEQCAKIIIDET